MNSKIKVEMTLTQAHLYQSTLWVAANELPAEDKLQIEVLLKLRQKILDVFESLDLSENERYVDEFNRKMKK